MKVSQDVMHELQHLVTDGKEAVIVDQLDRKLYSAVNKVLQAAGGKWNRYTKAHVFPGDAAEALEQVILTGEIVDKRAELQFFETPAAMVQRMIMLADIRSGMSLLEPEAGRGAIAIELLETRPASLLCFEIDQDNRSRLGEALANRAMTIKHNPGMTVDIRGDDFLSINEVPIIDRVVMNPPFAKRADIAHIAHAHKFLKPGGKLVSVASSAVMWRDDKLGGRFRELVDMHGGKITLLPEGSFKTSGTMVNTCLVEMSA